MPVSMESPATGEIVAASRPSSSTRSTAFSRCAVAIWASPFKAGLVSAAVYALLAAVFCPNRLGQSLHPYFVYLADAFLHGQLALVEIPPIVSDLSFFQGHYYLYWGPLPALLFLPLVALFGIGVSDAPLTIAMGGLNVALVSMSLAALSERGLAKLTIEKRAWLTAFFALGTVHVTLAPYARVWYTSQVVGLAMMAAAYLAALRLPRRSAPLVSGGFVAFAFLTRNSMLLAGLWIPWYLLMTRDRTDRLSAVKTVAAWLAPLGGAMVLTGVYNYLRFGNALEMGLTYHLMSSHLVADYQRYGAFNLHYLPTNLYYDFLTIPYLALFQGEQGSAFWRGGSLFLMSPVFFLAVLGAVRFWKSHGGVLTAVCLLGLVPTLLVMGTGFVQFGPRYTLDIMMPLLLLTARGVEDAPVSLLARLSMISFILYLPGAMLLGASWAA